MKDGKAGRWGCRQLNIHSARLFQEARHKFPRKIPVFADRTNPTRTSPGSWKLTSESFIVYGNGERLHPLIRRVFSREPLSTSLENAIADRPKHSRQKNGLRLDPDTSVFGGKRGDQHHQAHACASVGTKDSILRFRLVIVGVALRATGQNLLGDQS